MNKILKAYYESALALKLPVTYIDEIRSLNIYLGKNNYFLIRGVTQLNNASSMFISNNKHTIKLLFQDEDIPVPKGTTIYREKLQSHPLTELMEGVQFPVVAKPTRNTNNGADILCDIKNSGDLSRYLGIMLKKHTHMLIEEYQVGLKEYRVLLLNRRIIGVLECKHPFITGDGQNTITELMTRKYKKNRHKFAEAFLHINEDCINCLANQNLTPDSIPKQGQVIQLRNVINHALGGTIYSLNKRINPENAALICQAAKITGLDLVGFDIMCEDINLPFSKSKWMILKVNISPDITLHESPDRGNAIKVSKKILKQLIYRHPLSYLLHRLKLIFFL